MLIAAAPNNYRLLSWTAHRPALQGFRSFVSVGVTQDVVTFTISGFVICLHISTALWQIGLFLGLQNYGPIPQTALVSHMVQFKRDLKMFAGRCEGGSTHALPLYRAEMQSTSSLCDLAALNSAWNSVMKTWVATVSGHGAQKLRAVIQVSKGAERQSEVTNRPHDTWGGFTLWMPLM